MNSYFLALYDVEDNYIRDFDSISECAKYFNTTNHTIRQWLYDKKIKYKKYRIFKFKNNDSPQ